nr:GDSL esterase/lipase At4g10955-like [Ipomoea batatas]
MSGQPHILGPDLGNRNLDGLQSFMDTEAVVEGALYDTMVESKILSKSSHRSSVAACLVEGVYSREEERQQCCHGGDLASSAWWESFGFQLNQVLIDEKDKSIFGAVYELKLWSQAQAGKPQPPKLVIAFRGTLIEKMSWLQDFRLDRHIVQNTLHNSNRVLDGLQVVHTAVSKVGAENVWLAGHSLGSSIALLVGRNMVKMGYYLKTYLFNPPFVSLPTQLIKYPKLQEGIRLFHTAFKTGMAVTMTQREDRRRNWTACGAEFSTVHGGECDGKDCMPSHLIPSAYLTINLNGSKRDAHNLSQWWHPHLKLHHKLYQVSIWSKDSFRGRALQQQRLSFSVKKDLPSSNRRSISFSINSNRSLVYFFDNASITAATVTGWCVIASFILKLNCGGVALRLTTQRKSIEVVESVGVAGKSDPKQTAKYFRLEVSSANGIRRVNEQVWNPWEQYTELFIVFYNFIVLGTTTHRGDGHSGFDDGADKMNPFSELRVLD